MSLLDQVSKASDNDLNNHTAEELEQAIDQLTQEKDQVRLQVVRVRKLLNAKLQHKQLHARYGSTIVELASKVGPEQAQAILKEATKNLNEQVLKPERIVAQSKSLPLNLAKK